MTIDLISISQNVNRSITPTPIGHNRYTIFDGV
jgi:hypothetical protein